MDSYIKENFSKVISDKTLDFPLNLAMASAWTLANFKGMNVKIFDVRDNNNSLADFYVIGSSENINQSRAMAETLKELFKTNGTQLISYEGEETADWMLMDIGDVIVHIFQGPFREIYDLDQLWMSFPQVSIPEHYYVPEPQQEAIVSSNDSSNKGYF